MPLSVYSTVISAPVSSRYVNLRSVAVAVVIVEAVVGLTKYGLEVRHLRGFRAAADREVGLFTQLLARAGAAVVGADPLASRTQLALEHGAREAGDAKFAARAARELSDGRGADHVLVTGGGTDVLGRAAAL